MSSRSPTQTLVHILKLKCALKLSNGVDCVILRCPAYITSAIVVSILNKSLYIKSLSDL